MDVGKNYTEKNVEKILERLDLANLSVYDVKNCSELLEKRNGRFYKVGGRLVYAERLPVWKYKAACSAYDREFGFKPSRSRPRIYGGHNCGNGNGNGNGGICALETNYNKKSGILEVAALGIPQIKKFVDCVPNCFSFESSLEELIFDLQPVSFKFLERFLAKAKLSRDIIYCAIQDLAAEGKIYAIDGILLHSSVPKPNNENELAHRKKFLRRRSHTLEKIFKKKEAAAHLKYSSSEILEKIGALRDFYRAKNNDGVSHVN